VAYRDLQHFLELLRQQGELAEIHEQVSPALEISEIADRCVKRGGPALLFRQPAGFQTPVAINLFGTRRRMELALECEDLDALAAEIAELIDLRVPGGLWAKLKLLPKFSRLRFVEPLRVSRAPCQEVVETEQPSLAEIPILTCWPLDGGPYITMPLVHTRHPVRGSRNIGMYRLQVFDQRTLGMHWQLHKGGAEHYRVAEERGQRIEVAISLGDDPALVYAATAPLPPEIDELMLAGFLRRQRVELVRCVSVDLEVPANAQYVLEGYVDPSERRLEGPFGDHTGYYSLAEPFPVFHLTAITRRRDPIYLTTIVGPPPMEDGWLGKATERLFLPLVRRVLPELVDMNLPVEGIFHNLCIVSIDKRYPGQAKKVMSSIWGLGQLMFSKIIVVVDRDCDVQDLREVTWRVGTHIDPRRDILLTEGPVDQLDFSAPLEALGSKMGIDATRKWKEEGFERPWPPRIEMSPEVRARIDQLWPRLGLPPCGAAAPGLEPRRQS
jgi:4-hydroxy-3-polyprenylbenzoate decarboxylase